MHKYQSLCEPFKNSMSSPLTPVKKTVPPLEIVKNSENNTSAQEQTWEGPLFVHPGGFGFLECEERQESLFIPARFMKGALDGDWVLAGLLPPEARREREAGQVLEVLRRRCTRLAARLEWDQGELWALPFNAKLPDVWVEPASMPKAKDGDVVEVEIHYYPQDSKESPEGRVAKALPNKDNPYAWAQRVTLDLNPPLEFPKTCLKEASQASEGITYKGREDLCHLPFVTIDGEDARDFDDAIAWIANKEGSHAGGVLYVAIADVAELVAPRSAMDEEACTRGFSYYYPTHMVPMLPERLCTDLCSLRPQVARHTLTCEMHLDALGNTLQSRVFESVIESRARLTYAQVMQLFETQRASGPITQEIAKMLFRLRPMAKIMEHMRQNRGGLRFTFPERRFEINDQGMPVNIHLAWPSESTKLIEQCMLQANEAVAEYAAQQKLPFLRRVHEAPAADALATLQENLGAFGIPISPKGLATPGVLGQVLKAIAKHDAQERLEIMVLRALKQARYAATSLGHFALGAQHYAHFTSPIRRYPDLLLHRVLKAHLRKAPKIPQLPSHAGSLLSQAERVADEASGRVNKLFQVLYMEGYLGKSFMATVANISDQGAWLRLQDPPVEGLLPLVLFPKQTRYQQDGKCILVPKQPAIEIGTLLECQLVHAERQSYSLEFLYVKQVPSADPPKKRALKPPSPVLKKRAKRAIPKRMQAYKGKGTPHPSLALFRSGDTP